MEDKDLKILKDLIVEVVPAAVQSVLAEQSKAEGQDKPEEPPINAETGRKWTKKQIMDVKSRKERVQLIRENMDLF